MIILDIYKNHKNDYIYNYVCAPTLSFKDIHELSIYK